MALKNKLIFICSKCEAQFPRWLGQCSECGSWGTVMQVSEDSSETKKKKLSSLASEAISFSGIKAQNFIRIQTQIKELDCVLGGGIVPGSLILLGGEPGIGKSTLVLQIVCGRAFNDNDDVALYVSGEESCEQIKMRIDRLGLNDEHLSFLGETNIEVICGTIEKNKPKIAIIDSIQTMFFSGLPSEAGSINQVRACTSKILEVAKRNNIPIFITGHVTKEGMVAGPKTLEHLVDTVLYLEGDPYHQFRLLRAIKNRFGATNEVGVFEMQDSGLKEVLNPSQVFLNNNNELLPGNVIAIILEGTRPFLVEVQALVNKTCFGYPQRRSNGFDLNRLQLLAAVLNRRANLNLGAMDIHLNIVGGIKVEEPAIDLAVCAAIISAYQNKPFSRDMAFVGEVGLGGEIRSVNSLEQRINEATKIGIKKVFLPASPSQGGLASKIDKKKFKTELVELKNIRDLMKIW